MSASLCQIYPSSICFCPLLLDLAVCPCLPIDLSAEFWLFHFLGPMSSFTGFGQVLERRPKSRWLGWDSKVDLEKRRVSISQRHAAGLIGRVGPGSGFLARWYG
jgi:hypothetical protein